MFVTVDVKHRCFRYSKFASLNHLYMLEMVQPGFTFNHAIESAFIWTMEGWWHFLPIHLLILVPTGFWTTLARLIHSLCGACVVRTEVIVCAPRRLFHSTWGMLATKGLGHVWDQIVLWLFGLVYQFSLELKIPIQIWKLSVRMGVCLTTRVAQCDDICGFFPAAISSQIWLKRSTLATRPEIKNGPWFQFSRQSSNTCGFRCWSRRSPTGNPLSIIPRHPRERLEDEIPNTWRFGSLISQKGMDYIQSDQDLWVDVGIWLTPQKWYPSCNYLVLIEKKMRESIRHCKRLEVSWHIDTLQVSRVYGCHMCSGQGQGFARAPESWNLRNRHFITCVTCVERDGACVIDI